MIPDLLLLEGKVMGAFNLYEILDVPYDASAADIKLAYKNKIIQAPSGMSERYKTAYAVLIDDKKRKKYDYVIGLRKYRKIKMYRRIMKGISRLILTVLDAFCSFYKCFLVSMLFVLIWLTYEEFDYVSYECVQEMVIHYRFEIRMALIIGIVDLIIHRYVRRLNRFLKNYNWEVR